MKKFFAICAVVTMFSVVNGIASGAIVESGGWANVDYNISLPGSSIEYQHTHAEAGFDIATGLPTSVDDDYSLPFSYAYASTSHSWGVGEAYTASDYLSASNYASADASVSQSWGYGSTIYRVDFTLDADQTIDIGYDFDGMIWVDSGSTAGSGFSIALFSIWIDDPGMAGDPAYDSDPDWNDFVAVTGIGYDEKTLHDSGTISHLFAAGSHQIALIVDTYENAAVPEPATILVWGLLGLVAAGYGVWRRRR